MTLPQDTRAPHRQQRWIELENVGDSTVPPFGVVEIVGSYRPEVGGLVPGDGPTVVKVKQPTMDSLSHFYVNGPVEIPVGKHGPPGTNDFPCMVAYEQQVTPASGQMWGTVKNSYLIGRGRQGIAIVGDADSTLGIVRVNRLERLLRVSPSQTPLMPGETQECYVLRWDGANWVQTTTLIQVADPFFRTCAFPGEEFWCEAYGESFQTVSEFGLRRRGIAVEQIQGNSTGLVNLSSIQPAGGGVIPSCVGDRLGPVIDGCYRTATGAAINIDDEVFAHYHPEFRRWFLLPVGGSTHIRFEMRTALPLGGQGEAIEITSSPPYTRIGANFPIKDPWTPGCWRFDPRPNSQARGYMGWCVIPPNPELINGVPVREIVWMEQIARSINFTLTEDIASGQSGLVGQASINPFSTTHTISGKFYLGKDPAETDLVDESGFIMVHDPQRNYPRALKDAKGKARYNDIEHQYEIIECNQMATMLKATCAQMCPSDTGASVQDYEPMTFPPYGQKPLNVSTALNDWGLAHEGESRNCLVWDESLEDWIVLQVTHVPKYLALYTEIAQDGCAILINTPRIEVAVMTCGNTSATGDQIGLTSYDVVTSVSVSHEPGTSGSGSEGPTAGACNFSVGKTSICALPGTGSPATDVIELQPLLAVQDVFIDGLCVKGTVIIGYVFCIDSPDEVTFFCGTECVVQSGSQ